MSSAFAIVSISYQAVRPNRNASFAYHCAKAGAINVCRNFGTANAKPWRAAAKGLADTTAYSNLHYHEA